MEKPAADFSADDLTELFRILSGKLALVDGQAETDDLRRSIEARMPSIIAANEAPDQDEVSSKNLLFTSLVLASYQELRGRIDEGAKAVELLRTAFSDLFRPKIRGYIKQRFDVEIEAPDTAFGNIAKNFVANGQSGFGAGFTYEQEVQNDHQSFINVTQCSFLDFFRANNAPELTFVICAMDAVWAEELNSNPYNVSFERPTLMSQGADKCRFQFTRVGV